MIFISPAYTNAWTLITNAAVHVANEAADKQTCAMRWNEFNKIDIYVSRQVWHEKLQ